MKQIFNNNAWALLLMMAVAFSSAMALAQEEAPIQILFSLHEKDEYGAIKDIFHPDEPIPVKYQVINKSEETVITREGFFGQEFYLRISLQDPDGLPVSRKYESVDPEPLSPYRLEDMNVALGEEIPRYDETAVNPVVNAALIDDIRSYFNMPDKLGWYMAVIEVPLEVFSKIYYYPPDEVDTLYKFVNLDEPPIIFNPLASTKIRFKIESSTPIVENTVQVNGSLLKIDPMFKPVVQRIPLENANVRIYRASSIPEDFYPIGWKIYSHIWSNVDHEGSFQTTSSGTGISPIFEQDDYLVLVECPIGVKRPYVGEFLAVDDDRWATDMSIEMNFRIIQLPGGKKVIGKTSTLTGSKLIITQPEFVEWEGSEAIYPIVFESQGDWEIETSLGPPKGFKVNQKSIGTSVDNENQAVQFVIKDNGGKWKETKVKYKIKHKNKTTKLEDKIGIKLSKKLAKKKNKHVYGDTQVSGPFKGGRLVQKKKDDD